MWKISTAILAVLITVLFLIATQRGRAADDQLRKAELAITYGTAKHCVLQETYAKLEKSCTDKELARKLAKFKQDYKTWYMHRGWLIEL